MNANPSAHMKRLQENRVTDGRFLTNVNCGKDFNSSHILPELNPKEYALYCDLGSCSRDYPNLDTDQKDDAEQTEFAEEKTFEGKSKDDGKCLSSDPEDFDFDKGLTFKRQASLKSCFDEQNFEEHINLTPNAKVETSFDLHGEAKDKSDINNKRRTKKSLVLDIVPLLLYNIFRLLERLMLIKEVARLTEIYTTVSNSGSTSMKTLLLGSGILALQFSSATANIDFIPILSISNYCNIDLTKGVPKCGNDHTWAIHCLQDDHGQVGISCAEKTWVVKGRCPYFRRKFNVIDYRPCVADSLLCPNDQDLYMSSDVYKYPGCLVNNSSLPQNTSVKSTTEISKDSVSGSDAICRDPFIVIVILVALSCVVLYRENTGC